MTTDPSLEDFKLADLLVEGQWRSWFPEWDDATEEGVQTLADAFELWCADVWFIRIPGKGRTKLELSNAQREYIETCIRSRYTIALKARQIGFSTVTAAFVFWACFGYSDRAVAMLSRNERMAIDLMRLAKYGYGQLPQWVKDYGPLLTGKNMLSMPFSNDSIIESLPSRDDPARGKSLWLVVIDEMAFLTNPEDAWASVEPVIDVGGRMITLSTANGEGNIFHDLWQGSQTGTGPGRNFAGVFFPWSAAAVDRPQGWYEAKKLELPDWQLAQEYPSNPEEAFLRSGRPMFDTEALRRQVVLAPQRGYLHRRRREIEFEEDGGALRVWAEPQPRGLYVIGADVAEGLDHGDYSAAHVIDVRNAEVVAMWHGHVDADVFGSEILFILGQWYNWALLGVEKNNHGLTTITALRDAKYRNLYRSRKLGSRKVKQTEELGWRTTQTTKPLAIDELVKEVREESLSIHDAETLAEMRTFVREGNGKMHGSPHDDRVMSLAIANQMRKYAFWKEYTVEDKPGPGSMAWLEAYMYREERKSKGRIGANAARKVS